MNKTIIDARDSLLNTFCQQQQLPPHYLAMAQQWFVPLAFDIAKSHSSSTPLLVGINGCQGSGKSTVSSLLKRLLEKCHQKTTVVLSIDDFYLTQQEREDLAATTHPLLTTRGVPGTHDMELLVDCIEQLRQQQTTHIPRFNKATDNRHPKNQWDEINQAVDIIILEGWCVGSPSQSTDTLKTSINTLEAEEDKDGRWRQASNQQLATRYKHLFDQIDTLIMLKAPNFDCVYEWRKKQEDKLRAKYINTSNTQNKPTSGVMDDKTLQRFIQHYQRITQHTLDTLPELADIVLTLDKNHRIIHRKDKCSHDE